MPPPASPGGTPTVRETLGFGALVILSGVVGALGAAAFHRVLALLMRWAYGSPANILTVGLGLGPVARLLYPAAAGLAAGLIGLAATRGGGHAIPEIMEAVVMGRTSFHLRSTLVKTGASVVALAGGCSIGREGPIARLGAVLAGAIGRFFSLDERRVRILLAAGMAAGLTGAYRTPIAATLFVLEIVAGSFALDLVVPTALASVVAMVTTSAIGEEGFIFRVPAQFTLVSAWEALPYALLGVLCGLLAAGFLAFLDRSEHLLGKVRVPRAALALIGGVGVGVISAVGFPHVLGNGFETTSQIIEGSYTIPFLLGLAVAKVVATTLAVSSGIPGGVFTPTLLIGAAAGGVVGQSAQALLPAGVVGSPGGYALVGMAAMLAATTHAPITAAVMIFEMSGDYAIILPVMGSAVIATVITRRLVKDSIYTGELKRKGILWEASLSERLAQAVKARDLARPGLPPVAPSTPFSEICRLFEEERAPCIHVFDPTRGYEGFIDLHTVKGFLGADEISHLIVAHDLTVPGPRASPDDPLPELSEKLWAQEAGELPVVDDGPPPAFLGVIGRRDLLGAFDREIIRRDLLLTRVTWHEGDRRASDLVELPRGFRLAEVRVPGWLVGRTLREIDLRGRIGVNVVAVFGVYEIGEGTAPLPDRRLATGDRLLVVGDARGIALLARESPPPSGL